MNFDFHQTVEVLLKGIQEGAGDLLKSAGESEEFFRGLAQDFAEELEKLLLSKTEPERQSHLTNLEHLKAQAEIRLATIATRLEREAKDKILRVAKTTLLTALLSFTR